MLIFKVLSFLYLGSFVLILPLVGVPSAFTDGSPYLAGLMIVGGFAGAAGGAAMWLGQDGERASGNVSPGCLMFLIGVIATGLFLVIGGIEGYGAFVPIMGLLVTATATRTGLPPIFLGGLGLWLVLVYGAGHVRTFSAGGLLVQCAILLVLFIVASIARRNISWDFKEAPGRAAGAP